MKTISRSGIGWWWGMLSGGLILVAASGRGALPPTELPGLAYERPYFPGADYDGRVPTPEAVLGFPVGSQAATPAQVRACVQAWTEAGSRAFRVEYARTYEGRPLYYVVITAAENRERLESIRARMGKLADPRGIDEAEAEAIMEEIPPVAWLAYTIHGDETEGSDAALAVMYHLIADRSEATRGLLQDLVVIVDPLMNPDGRARFLKMIAENRGVAPNVDDRALVHRGEWPRGRGNHYLFDLNRDWILGVHPETRGRIRAVRQWNPVLFVDAHGMGPQETHLFSPPRDPINPNIPRHRRHWGEIFAHDQAEAFDKLGWVYYHGEWHEEWYPGYSDAYASYRGAIGILYEQARIAENGVRRAGGRILSYRESVHHHVAGSMSNLNSARRHARELLRGFYRTRCRAVAPDGPYAGRTFAVWPTDHAARLERLADLMEMHGIETFRNPAEWTVASAKDQLGRGRSGVVVPAGALLIPSRQPLAHLVAAMLEFDPRFTKPVLRDERKEILAHGRSKIYDTTAWNLTMMFGLKAMTLAVATPDSLPAWTSTPPKVSMPPNTPKEFVGYAIDGGDDRSVAAAARLMERGVAVRLADRPFEFDDRQFARGSIVITRLDNREYQEDDLVSALAQTGSELGLAVHGLHTGLGAGDLPDLGGEHFQRLEPPRIALLGGVGVSTYEYGSLWHLLDHRLGIRHSRVSAADLDLRRYNVLIVPGRWPEARDFTGLRESLDSWIRDGGTLIAIGRASARVADPQAKLSRVRELSGVLDQLDEYELALHREWLARIQAIPSPGALWSHQAPARLDYPWQHYAGKRPGTEELRRRDAWQKLFMPQGAILAGRLDPEHWLTVGCSGQFIPLLVGNDPVLMAGSEVDSVVRLGHFLPASGRPPIPPNHAESETEPAPDTTNSKDSPSRIGWAASPRGYDMFLRMSGLLWPEAAHRLANAAYLTRERHGRGQIILFSSSPNFRASTLASARLALNAIVYGPGLGTSPTIHP